MPNFSKYELYKEKFLKFFTISTDYLKFATVPSTKQVAKYFFRVNFIFTKAINCSAGFYKIFLS